jgi:hypothetical protein
MVKELERYKAEGADNVAFYGILFPTNCKKEFSAGDGDTYCARDVG